MICRLWPSALKDAFLPSDQVAQRISQSFQHVKVDDNKANDLLRLELQELKERGTPLPILQGHMNLFGRTTFVEVCSPSDENVHDRFMVYPDSPIEVFDVEDSEAARDFLRSIAKVLGYDLEFES